MSEESMIGRPMFAGSEGATVPSDVDPRREFIDSKTAAMWLGVPLRSFHRYVQQGLLPSYKLGKHHLFRRSELFRAILASRQATLDEILR
jgi:excisionase family DNA binding protein